MASLSVPEWCIGALQRSIRDLEHHCHGTSLHPHVRVLDAQQIQLEQVFREVVTAEVVYGSSHASAVVDLLREALSILHEEAEESVLHRYQAPMIGYSALGRPRFIIPRNQLVMLQVTHTSL